MQTDFLEKFLHFMLNELNDPLNLIETDFVIGKHQHCDRQVTVS